MIPSRFQKLNATTLKWIAVITMFIDHLTVCFLERVQDPVGRWTMASSSDAYYILDRIGRSIGRQAFPIFAFFIVEGFYHTRSRWRYLARLSLFAIISEGPFYLLNYTGAIGSRLTRSINVYATLALGLIAIWIVDVLFTRKLKAQDHRPDAMIAEEQDRGFPLLRLLLSMAAVLGICWFAWRLNTDYDYIGIITIVIFYVFHQLPMFGLPAAWVWMGCNNEYEWWSFPGILLLLCYNGERGGSKRHPALEKYFFYIFYPAHLLILWGIRKTIFGY